MSIKYRVYEAPEGGGEAYCGEFRSLVEAQEFAETEPSGLPEDQYDTAYAAGNCGGMVAPEGGTEDDEPISWHGASGWHCVVRVTH